MRPKVGKNKNRICTMPIGIFGEDTVFIFSYLGLLFQLYKILIILTRAKTKNTLNGGREDNWRC